MTRTATSLIRRFVGRLKENMEMFLMTMGGVMIPLGFVALFSGRETKDIVWLTTGIILVMFGLLAWFVASKIVRRREIQNAREKMYLAQQLENIHKDIVSSLKELTGEIKRGRNEQNKPKQ